MELKLGKLSPEVLERYLLNMTGAASPDLVVAPSLGVDFGVVKHGRTRLVVSSDPVTGVKDKVGWYAVNVNANDIATSGSRPQFLQSIILLPEKASVRDVAKISSEIHRTASSLGITVVGGHTELTPGLRRPIVVMTAFAFADSYVTAADARAGDSIVLTKTAGVEGTAICASDSAALDGKVDAGVIRRGRAFLSKLSVVAEAGACYATGAVRAMHDCTEGGVLGAVYEMSRASNLGFELREREIPVAPETAAICSALKLDPLRLISSGALLVAVEPGREGEVIRAASRAGSGATVIGRFRRGRRTLLRADGAAEDISDAPSDEIWKVVGKQGL